MINELSTTTAEDNTLSYCGIITAALARCLETGRGHDAALDLVLKAWKGRIVPTAIDNHVAIALIAHAEDMITAEDAVKKMHLAFSTYTNTSKEQG